MRRVGDDKGEVVRASKVRLGLIFGAQTLLGLIPPQPPSNCVFEGTSGSLEGVPVRRVHTGRIFAASQFMALHILCFDPSYS